MVNHFSLLSCTNHNGLCPSLDFCDIFPAFFRFCTQHTPKLGAEHIDGLLGFAGWDLFLRTQPVTERGRTHRSTPRSLADLPLPVGRGRTTARGTSMCARSARQRVVNSSSAVHILCVCVPSLPITPPALWTRLCFAHLGSFRILSTLLLCLFFYPLLRFRVHAVIVNSTTLLYHTIKGSSRGMIVHTQAGIFKRARFRKVSENRIPQHRQPGYEVAFAYQNSDTK